MDPEPDLENKAIREGGGALFPISFPTQFFAFLFRQQHEPVPRPGHHCHWEVDVQQRLLQV
jgi:hypothetical protein